MALLREKRERADAWREALQDRDHARAERSLGRLLQMMGEMGLYVGADGDWEGGSDEEEWSEEGDYEGEDEEEDEE